MFIPSVPFTRCGSRLDAWCVQSASIENKPCLTELWGPQGQVEIGHLVERELIGLESEENYEYIQYLAHNCLSLFRRSIGVAQSIPMETAPSVD